MSHCMPRRALVARDGAERGDPDVERRPAPADQGDMDCNSCNRGDQRRGS
jgi:hypothetical protein